MNAPAVALHEVTVRHPGSPGIVALDGVSLTVPSGQLVALVGPSGAGKSTLLRLCNGLAQPTAGAVEILGRQLAELAARELRALRGDIATVHQHLDLVGPLRVVHNVNAGRLGRWPAARAMRSLVRPAGTAEVRAALGAVGIAHLLHERTDRLSGGEQQRVALARALVQEPRLILADEPVSSLDPGRAADVMRLLAEVTRRSAATLLVSLHDPELARHTCDRLVGLRHGTVEFDLDAAGVDAAALSHLYRIDDVTARSQST